MNTDAATIMQQAATRGASQRNLVRAAAAAVRAVLPAVKTRGYFVRKAISASELWAKDPCELNQRAAQWAGLSLRWRVLGVSAGSRKYDPRDDLAVFAAYFLAVSTHNGASDMAILAVTLADGAAARLDVDLAPIVTAQFL